MGPAGLVAWHPRGARLAAAADGDGGRVRVLDLERCRAQVGRPPPAPPRARAHTSPPPPPPPPSSPAVSSALAPGWTLTNGLCGWSGVLRSSQGLHQHQPGA